jgi:5S rRNA maturation endonuclease (ribonuclease M5)
MLIKTLEDANFNVDLVEGGTELVLACPLCYDERRRLYIEAATGLWICFKCHARGHLRGLLIEVCELTPNEAFPLERAIMGGEKKSVMHVPRPAPASTVELPEGFIPLDDSPAASVTMAAEYLRQRGVSPTLAPELGIGFCLTGRYAYRVIIPVYTEGKLRTFVARTWVPTERKKVLMPKGSQAERALFGYDTLPCKIGPAGPCVHPGGIILVEGIFDALRMWELGHFHTLATLGAHTTELQRVLVKRLKPSLVILLRDADDTGREAAIKEAREFAVNMLPVSIARLPEAGADPDSASPEHIRQALDAAKPVELDYGVEAMTEVYR